MPTFIGSAPIKASSNHSSAPINPRLPAKRCRQSMAQSGGTGSTKWARPDRNPSLLPMSAIQWPHPMLHKAIWAKRRSEEHTSELQSLMRISYAVFCLKKKKRDSEYSTDRSSKRKTETQSRNYQHNLVSIY